MAELSCFPPVCAKATHSRTSCALGRSLSTPASSSVHLRETRGAGRKRMLKKCPLLSPTFTFPVLGLGSGKSTGQKRHLLPKKREAGPGGWGTHRAPSSGRGVSGRPAPHLSRQEEEGWSEKGARSNAPEYQGTAVKAFSSALQRPPALWPLHVSLHALLEPLAIVRVLGSVGEPCGCGVLANGVVCLIWGPL